MKHNHLISIFILILFITLGLYQCSNDKEKLDCKNCYAELSKGGQHTNPHGVLYHFKSDKEKTLSIIFPDSFNKIQHNCKLLHDPCNYSYIFNGTTFNISITFDHKRDAAVIDVKPDMQLARSQNNLLEQFIQSLQFIKKLK
jgi:hypothetical protein